MLPTLLARRAVTPSLLRRIAHRLADFHASAATGPGVDEYGSLPTIRANWQENFNQMAPFVGRTAAPAIQAGSCDVRPVVHDSSTAGYSSVASPRATSVKDTAISMPRASASEGHGSSSSTAWSSPLASAARTWRPRWRSWRWTSTTTAAPDLSAAFVDAYIRRSGDDELPCLLDFYRCYRAYVRGKVLSLQLDEPVLSPREAPRIEAQARDYFGLASIYAEASL